MEICYVKSLMDITNDNREDVTHKFFLRLLDTLLRLLLMGRIHFRNYKGGI